MSTGVACPLICISSRIISGTSCMSEIGHPSPRCRMSISADPSASAITDGRYTAFFQGLIGAITGGNSHPVSGKSSSDSESDIVCVRAPHRFVCDASVGPITVTFLRFPWVGFPLCFGSFFFSSPGPRAILDGHVGQRKRLRR
jgi:hypothetical protein